MQGMNADTPQTHQYVIQQCPETYHDYLTVALERNNRAVQSSWKNFEVIMIHVFANDKVLRRDWDNLLLSSECSRMAFLDFRAKFMEMSALLNKSEEECMIRLQDSLPH